jgi:hypothetical protein
MLTEEFKRSENFDGTFGLQQVAHAVPFGFGRDIDTIFVSFSKFGVPTLPCRALERFPKRHALTAG